jgi:hypothetical protein
MENNKAAARAYVLDRESINAKNLSNKNPNYEAPASTDTDTSKDTTAIKKRKSLPRHPPIQNQLLRFRLKQEATAIAESNELDKFDYYVPWTLRWYLDVFCSNLYKTEFTYLFPTYDDFSNQYKKEIHEYEIGRAKISVGDQQARLGFSSIRARLCNRHIIHHLSHENLTQEQLQCKYYWALTQAESEQSYPSYICLDIDSAIATNHNEPDEIYSAKNLPRTSSKLNRMINEVIDALHPATPILFTSSSGKLEKRHLYFLLNADVSHGFELSELKELVSIALSPVLSQYGINGWKNGEIEFYPSATKGVILPMGLNSQFMKRDGTTFRIYCKDYKEKNESGQWKKKYHQPSVYLSLEYLAKQDSEGKLHRIEKGRRLFDMQQFLLLCLNTRNSLHEVVKMSTMIDLVRILPGE